VTGFGALLRRELGAFFVTPVAWVYVVVFLVASTVLAFDVGGLYERGQADLDAFFAFHPWLHLVLVPAIAMRAWADERRSGTLELLLTFPVRLRTVVLAKFVAGWALVVVALALTFPLWLTVAWLGEPDHGTILAGYLGSALLAGTFLAIGQFASALGGSQVIAFLVTAAIATVYVLIGSPQVLDAADGVLPPVLIEALGAAGVLGHHEAMGRGLLRARDLAWFAVTIGGWLLATVLVLDARRTA
jgi:ABC-2 type transport system permease protein